jgi:hypothetical protein
MLNLSQVLKNASAALVFAALLGACDVATAQAKKAPPAKPTSPVKPTAAAKPIKSATAPVSQMKTQREVTPPRQVKTAVIEQPSKRPQIQPRVPTGTNVRTTKSGEIHTDRFGKVRDVHYTKNGMNIHHSLEGSRVISTNRPNRGQVFSESGRRGFVQRGYSFHNHDFGRRAYYYHGREYNRYYRGYAYRPGVYLNVYAPGYYYGPGFYGWAYNPWAAAVPFEWGWAGNPWYGYYGGYFSAYTAYPSASYWLTDYIISQDLQAAYAAHQEAALAVGEALAAGSPPALTPEVKQMIADEVKGQLSLENFEAQQNAQKQDGDPGLSSIDRFLRDGRRHVFVVGSGLDLIDMFGQECAVSEGDALELAARPPADATTANLVVLASKGGKECQRASTVAVNLIDLQEMQNHLRETIDQGLQELQAKQGKGGLPPAPPSAQVKPTQTEYAAIAPPPDPKDAADLQQLGQQADQAEKEVIADTTQVGGATAGSAAVPSASVELGQTTDQVKAALGAPTRMESKGPETVYYYDGMKVIFKAGKVNDVE